MGMDQKVTFAPDKTPTWAQVADFLAHRKFPVQMRMIDGEPAFPDETPSAAWRELRVGTPAGMVTLRRDGDGITLVTWGNADDKMRQAWNALTWAIAHVTDGNVGDASAAEFATSAELPEGLAG